MVIRSRLNAMQKAAGLPETGPHFLRHPGITIMADRSIDVWKLQAHAHPGLAGMVATRLGLRRAEVQATGTRTLRPPRPGAVSAYPPGPGRQGYGLNRPLDLVARPRRCSLARSLDLQLEVPTAFGAVKVGTTTAR